MVTSPYYSIIIPVYNNVDELDRCLRALQQSELRDQSEIIVIDDCSPEAKDVMEQTALKYNARYYRQAYNAGPGVARNRGAKEARGNILVFIDSDCVAPVGWLSELTRLIRDRKCFATISCYSGPVTRNWITIFQDEDYRYRMPSIECDTSFVNSCNFAIDRETFFKCGGFPEQRISEDMVLGLLLAENGTPARFVPEAGVLHDYYRSLSGYLRQRFSFAYNTVRSYLNRDNLRSRKANSKEHSFNPVRTALSMLFTFIAVVSFLLAGSAFFLKSDLAITFMYGGFISLLLETFVNGRFLIFLARRQGIVRAVSYIFLLYLIDMAYILGVLKGLLK